MNDVPSSSTEASSTPGLTPASLARSPAATFKPGAIITGNGRDTAQEIKESHVPGAGPAREISTLCYSWVQKFRKGQCNHSEALASITQVLIGSDFDAKSVGTSLRNYQTMLDTVRLIGTGPAEEERAVDKDLGSVVGVGQTRSQALSGDTRSQTGPGSESDTSANVTDDDDVISTISSSNHAGHSAKRQRLDITSSEHSTTETEASYPWESFHRCSSSLSVEQKRTKALLDNWNASERSFKQAYRSLLRVPSIPRFPRSQLKLILAGDFIDLDKVYASVNSLVAESNVRARLSDTVSIELEGEVTSTRYTNARVTDQASYTVASNLLFSIMLCVFGEYRRDELASYFNHIQTVFASISSQHHSCVLNYDKAVRLLIAQSNDVAFNEFHKFAHLERANLHPLGINVVTDLSIARTPRDRQPTSRRKLSRPVEICRNFNSGRCIKHASECQYRHICSSCHRTGHSAKDNKCTDGSAKAPATA